MIHKDLNARLSDDGEFTILNSYVVALKGILAIAVKARASRFRTVRRKWEHDTNHRGYRDKKRARDRKRQPREEMMEAAE